MIVRNELNKKRREMEEACIKMLDHNLLIKSKRTELNFLECQQESINSVFARLRSQYLKMKHDFEDTRRKPRRIIQPR